MLLQPSTANDEDLRYDMRVISQDVEYFDLTRDRPMKSSDHLPSDGTDYFTMDRGLRNSLWYYNGHQLCGWTDSNDLVRVGLLRQQKISPEPIIIPTDFYPTSVVLESGVVLGLDADLMQPRDVHFASFRLSTRVSLPRIHTGTS